MRLTASTYSLSFFCVLILFIYAIDDDDDTEVTEYDFDATRTICGDLIVIKVTDETVDNIVINNFAVMKSGVAIDDLPKMSGHIVGSMEEGSTVAEFTYPARTSKSTSSVPPVMLLPTNSGLPRMLLDRLDKHLVLESPVSYS